MSAQSTAAARPASRARVGAFLEENGTLVMVVGAFAVAMLAALRTGLGTDGWLALVAGREIVQHGLPTHDTLTLWTQGRRWVDQQWLSQLALYGLWRTGGLKLALLAHATLAVGGLAGAAALARKIGGSARSATWVALPVLVCYYPAAAVMRPQSLAYPLFVAVLWLLVVDARRPSRRVFATLPLLALWANLHGSALLGAALVTLAGLVGLGQTLMATRRVSWRTVSLVLLPWPCLLVSPYAAHLPSYYETVTVRGDFGSFVTEWTPTTLTATTVPFYLLVLGGLWLLGRADRRLTAFESLALVATAVLGFQAVRNVTWFALVALALLPLMLDGMRRPAVEPRRLNRMLATVVAAGVVVAVAAVATNDRSWFLRSFPPQAAAAASAAAGPNGRILATSSYADWLLWARPELRGRVAYDARFELMTHAQLREAQNFQARVEGWRQTASRYRVLVISTGDDRKLRFALVHSGIAHAVRTAGGLVVLRTTG
jgi:hypothetical protein